MGVLSSNPLKSYSTAPTMLHVAKLCSHGRTDPDKVTLVSAGSTSPQARKGKEIAHELRIMREAARCEYHSHLRSDPFLARISDARYDTSDLPSRFYHQALNPVGNPNVYSQVLADLRHLRNRNDPTVCHLWIRIKWNHDTSIWDTIFFQVGQIVDEVICRPKQKASALVHLTNSRPSAVVHGFHQGVVPLRDSHERSVGVEVLGSCRPLAVAQKIFFDVFDANVLQMAVVWHPRPKGRLTRRPTDLRSLLQEDHR